MEGRTKCSDKTNAKFLARFKGKLGNFDKTGHLGVIAKAAKPIEKSTKRYNEQKQKDQYTVTGIFHNHIIIK